MRQVLYDDNASMEEHCKHYVENPPADPRYLFATSLTVLFKTQ